MDNIDEIIKQAKRDYYKKYRDANKDKLNQLAQKNGFRLYNDYYYRNTTVDRDYTSVLCFDFDEVNANADIDKFERALDRYFGKVDYRYFLELLPRVKRICIYYWFNYIYLTYLYDWIGEICNHITKGLILWLKNIKITISYT